MGAHRRSVAVAVEVPTLHRAKIGAPDTLGVGFFVTPGVFAVDIAHAAGGVEMVANVLSPNAKPIVVARSPSSMDTYSAGGAMGFF